MTKKTITKRGKQTGAKIAAGSEALPEPAASASVAVEEVAEPMAKTVRSGKKHPKEAEPDGKKTKLIRDSYTLPESDYLLFKVLKNRCLASGVEVKKSELLRVALIALAKLNDAQLIRAVEALPRIKTGRPAKK